MTDPTPVAVAVPVELINRAISWGTVHNWDEEIADDLRALLPKPTPRLVAVDLEDGHDRWHKTDLESQPDLLTMLENAVRAEGKYQGNSAVYCQEVIDRIHTALGVTE